MKVHNIRDCKVDGNDEPFCFEDIPEYTDNHGAVGHEGVEAQRCSCWTTFTSETPEEYVRYSHDLKKSLIEDWKKSHTQAAPSWMLHSVNAELFFSGTIFAHAAYLGVETDHRDVHTFHVQWLVLEFFFLLIFTVELILRMCAERRKFIHTGWNVFDTFLVLIGILGTCILTPIWLMSHDKSNHLTMFYVFRVMRMARLAQILRILRVIRFHYELMLLLKSIAGTMKALTWSMLLLLLVLYTTATLITNLVGKNDNFKSREDIQGYFGSMSKSLFTLFQLVTTEGWNEVSRDMMADDVLGFQISIFFTIFVAFTNFTLLNLITGVMLENVVRTANQGEDDKIELMKKAQLESIERLQAAFREIDDNHDGLVTLDELQRSLRTGSSAMKDTFNKLGVSAFNAGELFLVLDYDHSGALTLEEFVFGLGEVIGAESGMSGKHLVGLECLARKMWTSIHTQNRNCTEAIMSIEQRLDRVELLMKRFLTRSTGRKEQLERAEHLFLRVIQRCPPDSVIL